MGHPIKKSSIWKDSIITVEFYATVTWKTKFFELLCFDLSGQYCNLPAFVRLLLKTLVNKTQITLSLWLFYSASLLCHFYQCLFPLAYDHI